MVRVRISRKFIYITITLKIHLITYTSCAFFLFILFNSKKNISRYTYNVNMYTYNIRYTIFRHNSKYNSFRKRFRPPIEISLPLISCALSPKGLQATRKSSALVELRRFGIKSKISCTQFV